MRVSAVEANDGHAKLAELAPQPSRRHAALEAGTIEVSAMLAEARREQLRIARNLALENNLAAVVDDAYGCLL